MSLTIGVDAGGTKTTGVVLNEQGEILFHVQAGFGNPNINFDLALSNVWKAVSACLNSPYGVNCKNIVLGISGIETKSNRRGFMEFFKKKTKIPVILVNDAVLAYHALLGHQDGILTIAGTGSISYGRKGEMESYAGGWGHLLGDFGSAYFTAIQAFQQITIEADKGIPHSSLSNAIMKKIGVKKAEEIKSFIYAASKGEIAALSHTIFEEAESGDELAKLYFTKAGEDLARQTATLYERLELTSPLTVACMGSMLEKNHYIQKSFQSNLEQLVGEVKLVMSDVTPAVGALTVATIYEGSQESN